jgi:hypothetical protein
MTTDAAPAPQAGNTAPEAGGSAETGLLELAMEWVAAAGSRVRCTAELALAEVRLAATSMALMLVLAIVAAGFVLAAWGLLLASLVVGLVAWGLSLWAALAGLGALHVLCSWLLLRWIASLSVHLELPVTRGQLSGAAEEDHSDGAF